MVCLGEASHATATRPTQSARSSRLATRERPAPGLVVWAHNSHLGDARATEMGWRGEVNVGELLRERYGEDVLLVGMTTHISEVTAASDWGGDVQRKRVRPRPDTYPWAV